MSCLNHWIPAFAGMTFLLNARLHLSPAGHENEWLKSLILKVNTYILEYSDLFRVCLTIILQIIGITLFYLRAFLLGNDGGIIGIGAFFIEKGGVFNLVQLFF